MEYNKKAVWSIFFLLIIGGVFGTSAYYYSRSMFPNTFTTKPYSVSYQEEFLSPDNWVPGVETKKEVIAKNTGDVDIAVCISYEEEWVSENGVPLNLIQNGERVSLLNFANQKDFIKHNDKYLYLHKLEKGESTTSFIKSVTFNPNAFKDEDCSYEGNKVICNSSGNDYIGGTYTLTINVDTVQYNARSEVCGADIEELKKQLGTVVVNNTIEGTNESLEFSYHVTFNEPTLSGNYGEIHNEAGVLMREVELINGVADFTLSNGESVTFSYLPSGLSYQVLAINQEGYKTDVITENNEGVTIPGVIIVEYKSEK